MFGVAAGDGEPAVAQLVGDVQIGCRGADRGELIAEILVERLKPVGQHHLGAPVRIQVGDTVVDVFHLVAFDPAVVQELIRRIQRMINFEIRTPLLEASGDPDIAVKDARRIRRWYLPQPSRRAPGPTSRYCLMPVSRNHCGSRR